MSSGRAGEPGAAPEKRLPDTADVVVVGAGPTGLAAAAACAETALVTVVLDPAPERPWPQTFAAWADELPADVGESLWSHSWSDVYAETDNGSIELGRRYVLLDNAALQHQLLGRISAGGGRVVAGRVHRARPADRSITLSLDVDRVVRARAVIDASGHRPALVTAPQRPRPAMQTAYGIIGTFAAPPAIRNAMTFMDWSTRGVAHNREPSRGEGPRRAPTFLYAMHLGGDRWLAEETCLAARPALPVAVLSQLLTQRLERRGATPVTVERTERVAFPMGATLPFRDQPVIGFGAAAGMVHPATGYQVAKALRLAPVLAAAIAEGLRAGQPVPEVARAGWSVVWPTDALRQRALFELGLTALLRMDGRRLQAFFETFFTRDAADWGVYLSGTGSSADVRRAMKRVMAAAPLTVKLALVRGALANPRLLAAATA